MGVLDEIAAANEHFAERFGIGDLPAPPSRHLAVVTCMDARILPLGVFGLEAGDAHIIRNAGGRVTDDAVRSLLVSTHLLGVRAIAVVHHTKCGMTTNSDAQIREAVAKGSGHEPTGIEFHAIDDPEADLRHDVARIVESDLFPPATEVGGYVYDVETGRLRKVC